MANVTPTVTIKQNYQNYKEAIFEVAVADSDDVIVFSDVYDIVFADVKVKNDTTGRTDVVCIVSGDNDNELTIMTESLSDVKLIGKVLYKKNTA